MPRRNGRENQPRTRKWPNHCCREQFLYGGAIRAVESLFSRWAGQWYRAVSGEHDFIKGRSAGALTPTDRRKLQGETEFFRRIAKRHFVLSPEDRARVQGRQQSALDGQWWQRGRCAAYRRRTGGKISPSTKGAPGDCPHNGLLDPHRRF